MSDIDREPYNHQLATDNTLQTVSSVTIFKWTESILVTSRGHKYNHHSYEWIIQAV